MNSNNIYNTTCLKQIKNFPLKSSAVSIVLINSINLTFQNNSRNSSDLHSNYNFYAAAITKLIGKNRDAVYRQLLLF